MITPSDHMSTSVPYMCPFRISGATYHGEPQSVTRRPVSVLAVLFAKPKSAAPHTSHLHPPILIWPVLLSTRMFSGFRSRWAMFSL